VFHALTPLTFQVVKPMLAWSFNHDGEAKPGLVERRDKQMEMNTSERRQGRQDLVALAKPQAGAEALFGGRLWARRYATPRTEALVKCSVLNRMTQLGMPETLRMG
jgi:hypothetical protein